MTTDTAAVAIIVDGANATMIDHGSLATTIERLVV
jgi:hypothetical protein